MTRHAHGVPFSGSVYKATKQNVFELRKGNLTGVIVCLQDQEIAEVLFYGSSGLIIPEQPSLSHQCLRLRNARIPYVMLSEADMNRIPDGAHAVADGKFLRVGGIVK